jgi:hypothetical protein
MKRGHRGETKDYSDVFLAAILIGIIVIVLSLMMAISHSTSRLSGVLGGMVRDDDHHLYSRIGHRGGLNSDPELTMAKFLYASLEPK